MQTRLRVLSAGLIMAVAAQITLAQAPQPNTYSSVSYYYVSPQNDAAYLELVRTAGRKSLTELMRTNNKMTRYSLRRVVYPGVPAPPYNYVTTLSYDGPPPEFTPPTPGTANAEYFQKVNSLRTSVGNIIVRTIATTGAAAYKEGEYLAVSRAKIETGRRAEFFDMRTSLMLPIMAARVKEGAIKSWSMSSVVFPGGESTAWDASTSSVYKDLASALTTGAGPGTGVGANAAIFAKVHPDKSYVAYVDSLRATSKTVRRELQRFVIVIDRSSIPSSGQ